MKITHNYKTGKTVIALDWQETRQFISTEAAQVAVVADVKKLVDAKPKG